MAVYEILPSNNLKVADIRDTLNANGGVTDNDFGSMFGTGAHINKWAKKKPTVYGKAFEKGNEEPAIWQAENGLCGFKEESVLFTDVDAMVSAIRENAVYVYEHPKGGSSSPFRIGDFRGYYAGAMSPIWSFDYSGQIYANDAGSSSVFTLMGNGDVDRSVNLTLADLLGDGVTSVSQWYFCVVVTNDSGNVVLTSKGGQLGPGADFVKDVVVTQKQLGVTGVYVAYAALCDAAERDFMACPIGGIEFQVLASADAEKLGWMAGTGYWQGGRRFTYQGQLAYSASLEGADVFIELQVNGVNYGNGELVKLTKDSESSDGKMFYMTYKREIIMSAASGDAYRLRCGYGSNLANNAYLDLVETTEPM